MKKTFIVLLIFMISLSNIYIIFSQNKIIGEVLSTDILAYIDNIPIKSFNINGYTYIISEDLRNFGFDVNWSPNDRTLKIERNFNTILEPNSTNILPTNKESIRKKLYNVYSTDISTYINKKEISAYNVGGQTLIQFDNLEAFGEIIWNSNKRIITLNLDNKSLPILENETNTNFTFISGWNLLRDDGAYFLLETNGSDIYSCNLKLISNSYNVKKSSFDKFLNFDGNLYSVEDFTFKENQSNLIVSNVEDYTAFNYLDKDGVVWDFKGNKILDNVKMISGSGRTMALKNDGTLWYWRYKYDESELDLSSFDMLPFWYLQIDIPSLNKPIKIMENIKYAEISNDSFFVIKDDNSLWGWGISQYMFAGLKSNPNVLIEESEIIKNIMDLEFNFNKDGLYKPYPSSKDVIAYEDIITKPILLTNDVKKLKLEGECIIAIKQDNSVYARGGTASLSNCFGTNIDSEGWYYVMDNVKDITVPTFHNSYCLILKNDNSIWFCGVYDKGIKEEERYFNIPVKIYDTNNN